MDPATFDFIARFEMGSIFFGDDDADNYVVTRLPVSARVDQNGLALYSPRNAGYARIQIDMLDELPEVDVSDWDFVADLYVHTLGSLGVGSVGTEEIFDTISRERIDAWIPVEMGVYRVRVLIANYHQTARRLIELRGDDHGEREADYRSLNSGRSADNRVELPTLEFLMACDHYRLFVAPVTEVSVLKPL